MLRQAAAALPRALRTAPRASATPSLMRPQAYAAAAPITRAFQPVVVVSRWYSDVKEEKSEPAEQPKPAAEPPKPAEANKEATPEESNEVTELKKQLTAKDTETRDWKDKCLRSIADFRNLQDRTQREVRAARDFAIQKFAKDLLDSVDNLDRALAIVPASKIQAADKNDDVQDLVNLYEGLKMTETILMQTLARHGLVGLEPVGEKFNPNEHEATFMSPQPDKENNTVFCVQQKGFVLNGRVLRAAKVGVVKNPVAAAVDAAADAKE